MASQNARTLRPLLRRRRRRRRVDDSPDGHADFDGPDGPTRERWLAALFVTLLGAALVWPACVGVMPATGDHPVHFGRAIEFGHALAKGTPFTWNPRLGIGVPVGDGYPPLADLLVVSLRALTLGRLPWANAYAVAFTIAFVSQGWAMLRLGRGLQVRPSFAAVAATMLLLSPGYPREGGWAYGVMLGVWPQLLATSATWWGLGDLLLLTRADDAYERLRHALLAGLAFGLGILAHPITLPVLALALPCLVLFAPIPRHQVVTPSDAVNTTRRSIARNWLVWCFQDRGALLVGAAVASFTSLALAAWWLVPMLDQRAWMASYGWLHAPLSSLLSLAAKGHFSHAMASAVGWTAAAGLVLGLVRRDEPARVVAAIAMLAWLLASRDTYEILRLDLLANGFGNLQYQRFVIFAEPGFLMLAVTVVQRLWSLRDDPPGLAATLAPSSSDANDTLSRAPSATDRAPHEAMRFATRAAAVGLALLCLATTASRARETGVGGTSTQRIAGERGIDDDLAALEAWLGERVRHEPLVRIAVVDGRNVHWFVDFAARLRVRLYKAGFLPGDNFVHKPESSRPELFDAARVEYVVTRREGPWGAPLERFGPVRVYARDPIVKLEAVHVEGPGEVIDIVEDVDTGELEFTLRGTNDTTRVVVHVPGHPRWQIVREDDPNPLAWIEVPMLPSLGERPAGLTPERRRAGEGRDGSARGPDGSEPTFLAVDAPGDGKFALRYEHWRTRDLAGLAVSAIASLAFVWFLRRPRPLPRVPTPTWALLALTLLTILAATKIVRQRRADERDTLTSRVAALDAESRPGAIKVDMRIRWAWVVRGATPAHEVLVPLDPGETHLRGWIALDDDAAMAAPRGRRTVFVEPIATDGTPKRERHIVSLPHRPGRRPVALDLRDAAGLAPSAVRLVIESTGKAPPTIGLSLEVTEE